MFVFASPLSPTTAYTNARGKKKKSLSVFSGVQKSVCLFVPVFCSVFTSCLHATHANSLTESCVSRSSVAVLDFITSLQLFLHIFALKCAIIDCFCYHLTSL